MFIENNNFNPQYVYNTKANSSGNVKVRSNGKNKLSTEMKGKKKKEQTGDVNNKGKRPASGDIAKDEEAKKIKAESTVSSNLVNSNPTASVVTGAVQSHRNEWT